MAVGSDIVVLESSHASDPSCSSRNSLSVGSAIAVLTIENVVSTVNLGCKLDLKAIAVRATNTEYNPKKFAALIMRIREPKTTALMFSSGKMVCTGAKTEEESRLAARKHARIIQKLGFDVNFKDFKIQNMVASYDFEYPLNLTRLAYSHNGEVSIYEPELFPGLVYLMKQLKTVVLVFSSGKIAIGGAQKRDELFKTFEKVYPILKAFKVDKSKEVPEEDHLTHILEKKTLDK